MPRTKYRPLTWSDVIAKRTSDLTKTERNLNTRYIIVALEPGSPLAGGSIKFRGRFLRAANSDTQYGSLSPGINIRNGALDPCDPEIQANENKDFIQKLIYAHPMFEYRPPDSSEAIVAVQRGDMFLITLGPSYGEYPVGLQGALAVDSRYKSRSPLEPLQRDIQCISLNDLFADEDQLTMAQYTQPSDKPYYEKEYEEGEREITTIVLHTTAGSEGAGAAQKVVNWMSGEHYVAVKDKNGNKIGEKQVFTSIHYVIDQGGNVVPMIPEKNEARHAGSANPYSIGIEHTGKVIASTYTETLYRTSAKLVADICARRGIPPDRKHILGHYEATKTDHFDVGADVWDWDKYMGYVEEAYNSISNRLTRAATYTSNITNSIARTDTSVKDDHDDNEHAG